MPKKLPAISTVARALVDGFKGAYENLGLSALHSAFWFVLHVPFIMVLYTAWSSLGAGLPGNEDLQPIPWLLILVPAILAGALLAAPANAAMLYTVNLAREDEARVRDFFIGFKRYFWRSAGVYSSYIVAVFILIADIVAAASFDYWFRFISIILALYVLLFVLMMSNYFFPLIVFQTNTFKKVWKKAALLALDNGLLTLVLSILTLLLLGISSVFTILLVLFFPAALGYAQHHLFEELLNKYEEGEPEAESTE